MRILIAYASYSGNTKEVAALVQDELTASDITADMHRIDHDPFVDVALYDYLFIGTFTWDYGDTPDEVKDFVYRIGYKPDNVAVFGTGDTQFGEERHYCMAVDKLANFYNSRWPGLKIEQSPRGSQEKIVQQWVKGVIEHAYATA